MVRTHASFDVRCRPAGGAAIALIGTAAVGAALGATLLVLQNLLPGLRALSAFGGALL